MAAAELKLQVGLDLAFFRQQLALLGPAAAGYSLPINIDRLAIQRELNSLGANINRRKYRLEVATNIAAEIKNAGTLAKALRGLDNAIQKNKGVANRTAGGAAGSVVDASKLEKSLKTATRPVLESVYNEMDRLGIRMAKAANDAGKTTNESLRVAILSGIPQVTADMAQGLAKGINPLMKINGQKGAKLFIEAWKDAAGIASPSKVFKALGEFSADGLEIGFINGLKDFKNKSVSEIRKIVALLKFELAKISGVSMAPAMSRSTGARGSQAYMSPIGPLPHGSKEPWAFSQGGYQPFMAQPGQTRGGGASRSGAPSIMGTISSPSMFGASFPALPSAGMTGGGGAYRQAQLQSRMAAAYARSAAREASVLGESQMYASVSGQVPLGNTAPRLPAGNQGGALALRNAPSGGRGGFGSFGGFRGAMANISLPSAGIVSELGGEFAMAAKQVLLFGTAYKALAFLTDFPSKVGEAVAQLQTFRNTLQAITPNADEFQKSNQFILDTVAKYNTPLQSARDGFTNLYASMAPAGFKGDEIRNLFAGISQGAATFGMSADKVDRVNYAFAQMASKGQVMSEELKGQLGDVLPGAVAIFAKAAGFEGPEAMVKFTKAMEDGRYKGEAMKQLLINVGIVMKDKFAAGAEGAAQTFQGQMNAMANATKKLYEAFVPVGNLFSSQIIAPFTSGLQVLAEGFNAFFSGVAAKTAGGFAFSQELEKLRPTIKGIMDNITQLMPVLQSFATTLLGLGKILLQIAGNPFVGYLARVYLAVLPLTMAIQALNLQALIPMIASFLRAIPAFTAYSVAAWNGASRTKALAIAMQTTGQTATVAGGQVVMLSNALKTAFMGTVVGAIVVGIGMIIERTMTLGAKMEEVAAKARGAQNAIMAMTKNEAIVEDRQLQRRINAIQELQNQTSKTGQKFTFLSPIQEEALRKAGGKSLTKVGYRGNQLQESPGGALSPIGSTAADVSMLEAAKQSLIQQQQFARAQVASVKNIEQTTNNLNLAPIPSAGGASASGGGAKPRAAARIPLEQLLDRNSSRAAQSRAAALDLALNERILQAKKDGNEQEQASLENLRPAIKARGELAALTEFHNMLVRNEAKIVGKSLTQAQFKERLQLAGQKMTIANINLENEYVDLRKKDLENNKQILDQQEQYQRTLEDIKIKNGEMTDEEIRRLEKLRQYQDILKANPSLTDLQKTDLFNAINAAPIDIIGEKLKAYRKNLDDMLNTKNQIVGIAESIGDSFGASFKGIIDGSMTAQQALAGFFQNLSNYFADAVSKMIAEWLKVEAIKGLTSLLGGLGGMFGGGGGGPLSDLNAPQTINNPLGYANGGLVPGGFRAFATGGIVTGPTLGLVGEGRYNEAVIPLPDGKSVPVDLGGEGARLGGNGGVSVGAINITVQNTGDTLSPAAQKQIAGQVQGIVLATMADQRRSGGLLR